MQESLFHTSDLRVSLFLIFISILLQIFIFSYIYLQIYLYKKYVSEILDKFIFTNLWI